MYEAIIAAEKSDVVVMFMGLNPTLESEESDFDGDRKDFELPSNQKVLYEAVKAVGKPIIFVNVSGGCVNLRRFARNRRLQHGKPNLPLLLR